jgi:uncharacterized Fe-S cluster-containing radical SAM superfamily protein
MVSICTSPISELKELKNIFIELTAKNCNKRCRECFIKFPLTKNVKDFIKTDIVKDVIKETKSENIECIYLTGAEPMTHPDFNTILRACLMRTNVCICTNGTFINEKKARFLKRVEDESQNRIIFKLSFTHFDEIQNDNIKSRGAYRQNLYALKCLDKYGFVNILSIGNYYKLPHDVIISNFHSKLKENGIENAIIQITEWCFENESVSEIQGELDCMYSRTVTNNGIFSCPFLANDYRGRTGSNFKDYSKTIRLETAFCATCIKNKERMFGVDINWS